MALSEYIRTNDLKRLVQDYYLEVGGVFYPPHFEDFEDLDVGDSDPLKVGAVATFKQGEEIYLAVYQGADVWKLAGGDTSGLVPYTGATEDVNLGANHLRLKDPAGGNVGVVLENNAGTEFASHGSFGSTYKRGNAIGGIEIAEERFRFLAPVNDVVAHWAIALLKGPFDNTQHKVEIEGGPARYTAYVPAIYGDNTLVPKKYVDDNAVKKSGDTMTGRLTLMEGSDTNPPLVIPPSTDMPVGPVNGAIMRSSDGTLYHDKITGRYRLIDESDKPIVESAVTIVPVTSVWAGTQAEYDAATNVEVFAIILIEEP